MKKVLIISYYFPPSGGPGVQRLLKFVKYLPEFGWEPVVLTVKDRSFPARDESLPNEIPPSTKVYRTKIFEPYRLYRKLTGKSAAAAVDAENIPPRTGKRSIAERLAGIVRETFFIPDTSIGWFPYAAPLALEICKREKVDALYSSSPPYSSAVIARELHKRTELPWIAGFRDLWIGSESSPGRWSFPNRIDRYLERSVYEEANLVECTRRGIVKDFQDKYPHLNPLKCLYLPDGFDQEDFPHRDEDAHNEFTITHASSFHGHGDPSTFLTAVSTLVQEGRIDHKRIRLKFIGRFDAEAKAMFESPILKNVIHVLSQVPHRDVMRELMVSDCLLFIADASKENGEVVPEEIFEYLGTHRPILALGKEGALLGILRETGTGKVIPNQDIGAIKRAIVECYENFIYHRKNFDPDEGKIKQYERREITHRLAGLFDYLQEHR